MFIKTLETKYGISKRANPDLGIAHPTVEEAKAIYKRDYWDKARCDEMSGPVVIAVSDTAVNHGVKAAVLLLQKSLGVEPHGNTWFLLCPVGWGDPKQHASPTPQRTE